MTLLDAVAALAMVLATGALWSGWRGGVAWSPACLIGIALGAWGFSEQAPLLLVACVLIIAAGAVLPVQLFAAARRRAGRGDFARAARHADRLYRLRRHPAAAEWRDNWRAAAAFYAGQPSEAWTRINALAARRDPAATMLRDALLASIRAWDHAVYSRALDLEVRARCELGEVERAVEDAGRAWSGRKPGLWLWRVWGLMLAPYAFAGRTQDLERAADLLRLGPDARTLWRATALAAAGDPARAEALLAPLDANQLSPGMRAALEARRGQLPSPVTLDAPARAVLDTASVELRAAHLLRPRPPWESWATLTVLVAVAAGFTAQLTGLRATVGLDALIVGPGEPVRPLSLLTYGLLHYGWTHLCTNLVALAFVAPIVAQGIGALGLLVVFFGGVVGAGGAVWVLSAPGIIVGASGGAMAVLAAAVLIAVAHPLTRRTRTASAAGRAALGIALLQFAFDALVPQVSMLAHLGGAFSGAILALPFVLKR